MRVGIIGLGNFGTAMANLIANNGYPVVGWEYNREVVEEVNQNHANSQFLPDVPLHEHLTATSKVEEAFEDTQIVLTAVPSVFIRPTLEPMRGKVDKDTILVNLAKGIDRETGLTAFQTLSELFPHHSRVMLSGPSVANEFSRGMPTLVTIAGQNRDRLLMVAQILDNDRFRTRFSDDEIGVEMGGVLKNIYAIGLGLFDGKSIHSINFRAAYITLALEEMARIGMGLGAKLETFLYISGMGDLLATSLSQHSHNRHMGELLASGLELPEIKEKMGVLPEGYNTLKTALYIAEKLHISLPLARGLWEVINGKCEVNTFINSFIKDFID
jgi:glycerol-3-phosphate dehydrogenase (NAD(P)+)